jgi:uncharacterized BrkB/YihY/UPF0761 family membrane protein
VAGRGAGHRIVDAGHLGIRLVRPQYRPLQPDVRLVGAGIALLVWMYLMALIALIGCEFNAEYERSSRPVGK